MADPDLATVRPDLPAIEVKTSAADAAEDRAVDAPTDATSAPGAPADQPWSPDQVREDDAPFARDATPEEASVSPDVPLAPFDLPGERSDIDAGVDGAVDAAPDGYWAPTVTYGDQKLTLAWCGDERMDWTQAITDPDASGIGACASTTVGQLITQVPAAFLPDAGYQLGGCYPRACLVDKAIKVLRHGDGFRLVFVFTNGGPGMHNPVTCDYFETDADCRPVQVGHFFDRDTVFDCVGLPLWGFPVERYCADTWSSCPLDASAP